ncbi:MAG: hypothetical protein Q4D38_00705 [Planctomycetia bacterium]|nr:hypothetical protein [Planctomycetia bacterium]
MRHFDSKNILAAVASLIVPGLGQLFQKRFFSAIFWFLLHLGLGIFSLGVNAAGTLFWIAAWLICVWNAATYNPE